MPAPKPLSLNNLPLNKAALRWLKQAKAEAPEYSPHLFNLAVWGVQEKVEGEWPEAHRHAVENQVGLMCGWQPENVMRWLLDNPNEDQAAQNLLTSLKGASSPREAAAIVLSQVYSRLQSQVPALQPAASELS
jgi:hypothetical protein